MKMKKQEEKRFVPCVARYYSQRAQGLLRRLDQLKVDAQKNGLHDPLFVQSVDRAHRALEEVPSIMLQNAAPRKQAANDSEQTTQAAVVECSPASAA